MYREKNYRSLLWRIIIPPQLLLDWPKYYFKQIRTTSMYFDLLLYLKSAVSPFYNIPKLGWYGGNDCSRISSAFLWDETTFENSPIFFIHYTNVVARSSQTNRKRGQTNQHWNAVKTHPSGLRMSIAIERLTTIYFLCFISKQMLRSLDFEYVCEWLMKWQQNIKKKRKYYINILAR